MEMKINIPDALGQLLEKLFPHIFPKESTATPPKDFAAAFPLDGGDPNLFRRLVDHIDKHPTSPAMEVLNDFVMTEQPAGSNNIGLRFPLPKQVQKNKGKKRAWTPQQKTERANHLLRTGLRTQLSAVPEQVTGARTPRTASQEGKRP